MTASTGKAAAAVNGITLHSAFDFPVRSRLKSYAYKNQSGKKPSYFEKQISAFTSFVDR